MALLCGRLAHRGRWGGEGCGPREGCRVSNEPRGWAAVGVHQFKLEKEFLETVNSGGSP